MTDRDLSAGESRPDPDALLKEVQREETRKGRLKIFLGYAPGVGKTYAMLQEAHVLQSRGEDVVIGIVETHGRAETEALVEKLEVLPRKEREYMGVMLRELNTDAVLSRRPSVVLVDELAHTNAPESRHVKRYQDVEELLDNGIDVYTTVNIQHFEGQVDVVAKITGIRVQETVPDTLLDRAGEVQIIDIPQEELLQRLKEGKVYIPERARHAIDNFFRRGNLVALRELTLTLVAHKMDAELLNYMRSKAITGPWPAGERVMVCIGPSPYAPQVLRRGAKIAKDTHAEWFAVYVASLSDRELSDEEKVYLADALNLASELGAKTSTLTGRDVASEILRFAGEHNITHIVIGKPMRPLFLEFWKRSPVYGLLRAKSEFEIHLVTPSATKEFTRARTRPGIRSLDVKDYTVGLLTVAIVTLLNLFLHKWVSPAILVFTYFIATITSALLGGMGPSVFATIMSLITFDFLFTEPRYSFSIYSATDVISMAVFFFTSLIVAQLVKVTKQQNLILQVRLRRVTLIEEMSKEFLALPPLEQLIGGFGHQVTEWKNVLHLFRTTVLDEISHITTKYLSGVIDAPTFVLFKGIDGRLQVWAKSAPETALDPHEMTVAEWTYEHGEQAGSGTATLPNVKVFFLPMKSQEETVGVIGVQCEFKNLLLDQRRLLGAISGLSSLAAARWAKI